jgi:predicted O-methyltransferase YrrM
MDAVMQRARVNLAQFGNQVDVNRGYSQQFLKSKHPALIKKTFDLAIIDGDHTADAVYQDAILTLPLMKKGSWMVFDDVRNRVRKKDHVQQGLDRFIRLNPGATQLAWRHRYCDCLEVL